MLSLDYYFMIQVKLIYDKRVKLLCLNTIYNKFILIDITTFFTTYFHLLIYTIISIKINK